MCNLLQITLVVSRDKCLHVLKAKAILQIVFTLLIPKCTASHGCFILWGHVLFCFVFAKSVIYVNTPEGEQPGTKYKRSVQRLDPYTASSKYLLGAMDARSTNPQKSKESNAKESFVSQKKRE